MSKKAKKKTRPLRDLFESFPVSRFNVDGGGDPAVLMAHLFGPETSVEPIYHCAHLGAWVTGWSVVTTLPDGRGAHAFVVRAYEGDEPEWDRLSRGSRINKVSRALERAWSAGDRVGLVTKMVGKVAKMDDRDLDFDQFGAFNAEYHVWVLRQALRVLDEEEREAAMFLLALSHGREALDRVFLLLERLEHVVVNWERVRESEAAVVAAVQRHNGVTIRGAQVERLGVAGALMAYPFESWADEADRLVALVYEREALPKDFHPQPPPPPSPSSGQRRRVSFPLAV